jgi:nucleoid-associated protein YgaU
VLLISKLFVLFLLVSLQIMLLCGCSDSVALLDGKDRDNTIVRDAAARMKDGNIAGALKLYSEALDKSPKLAVAHLDTAIILHDYKKDYLRAIYHYERYLELRPGAEKTRIIEDRIRLAGQSYAAKIAEDGSIVAEVGKLSKALTDLKKENDALKNNVRQLSLQIEQAKSGPGAAVVPVQKVRMTVPIQDDVPVGLPESSLRAGRQKTAVPQKYTVKRGDSLRSIAVAHYKEPGKADDIFKANRDKLGSPAQLKIGQVLTLP